MSAHLEITDHVIWFKHVHSSTFQRRLERLEPGDEIVLATDNVVGRWSRMQTGADGRPVYGIRPVGLVKDIWNEWFRTRKGALIEVREVSAGDDHLNQSSALFSEWTTPEDEAAFRDL